MPHIALQRRTPGRQTMCATARRPPDGGCTFAEHPDRRGDEATLFWRPELLPDLIRLIPLGSGADSPLLFDPGRWAARLAARPTEDGLHVVITPDHGPEYRLLLPGSEPPPLGAPLTVAIDPTPSLWQRRVTAAQRFLAFATEGCIANASALPSIAPEEAIRRAHMLWALDLETGGASEHQIGAALFGVTVASAAWSNHADRSEVRRLLVIGGTCVAAGYRRLLR